jgi:hypothetical protein
LRRAREQLVQQLNNDRGLNDRDTLVHKGWDLNEHNKHPFAHQCEDKPCRTDGFSSTTQVCPWLS